MKEPSKIDKEKQLEKHRFNKCIFMISKRQEEQRNTITLLQFKKRNVPPNKLTLNNSQLKLKKLLKHEPQNFDKPLHKTRCKMLCTSLFSLQAA